MCVITHSFEFFGKVSGSVVNSQNCARATLAINDLSNVAKLALAIAKAALTLCASDCTELFVPVVTKPHGYYESPRHASSFNSYNTSMKPQPLSPYKLSASTLLEPKARCLKSAYHLGGNLGLAAVNIIGLEVLCPVYKPQRARAR